MVVPVVASWLILRETPRRSARFDLAGAALLALGLGPLLLAVDQAPDWGLTAAPTPGMPCDRGRDARRVRPRGAAGRRCRWYR